MPEIWSASDPETLRPNRKFAELNKIAEDKWLLTVGEEDDSRYGQYAIINLDKKHLKDLHAAIENELYHQE